MTTSLGRPRFALPTNTGSVITPRAVNTAVLPALPLTLVDQLADALGAADVRCAKQRITLEPVACQPSPRAAIPYRPAAYINAESAPFLLAPAASDRKLVPALAQSPLMDVSPPCSSAAEPAEPADCWVDHDDAADLPRFFDTDRQSSARHAQPSPVTQTLSAATMALGFGIGLALILPTLWVASTENHATAKLAAATTSGPAISTAAGRASGITSPLLAASAVATFVPAAAFEVAERGAKAPTELERLELAELAFLEASRLIATGDYVGARDQLRQAITFGEERARTMLNALQ